MPYAEHLKQPGDLFAVTLKPANGLLWAYISDLQPVKRLSELQHQLRELEAACWRDGVMGWYCTCDHDNRQMRRWVEAVGGTAYQEHEGQVSYMKKIVEDPSTTWNPIKQMAHTMVSQEVGHG